MRKIAAFSLVLSFLSASAALCADLDGAVLDKVNRDHQTEVRDGSFAARKQQIGTHGGGRAIATDKGGVQAHDETFRDSGRQTGAKSPTASGPARLEKAPVLVAKTPSVIIRQVARRHQSRHSSKFGSGR